MFCDLDENRVCRKCGRLVTVTIAECFADKTFPAYVEPEIPAFVEEPASLPEESIADHPFECAHRGEVLRKVTCQQCGGRGEIVNVYECKLKDQCTIHAKAVRVNGRGTSLVAVCISCGDRQENPQ